LKWCRPGFCSQARRPLGKRPGPAKPRSTGDAAGLTSRLFEGAEEQSCVLAHDRSLRESHVPLESTIMANLIV
jgi:hypothetical protein